MQREQYMRFTESGPQIPDALLRARDEDRVVFFCGAGVSQARAGLTDFFGLAQSVIQRLGATKDCYAFKVLEKAKEIGEALDVTGLISADRVFSLLERDFTTSDIQAAVAKSLLPAADVDRSAHEILLRLARTRSGKTQLVTTNFDRLFEPVGAKIPLFQPPRLPKPSRRDDLDGIVYLHGCVDVEYARAEGNGLVLSSADFGHAYLSEGWATEFFREIVQRYVVVFIGYSADDPPVHYLLEGLRRDRTPLHGLYAFQSDGSAELTARWNHKGVDAITYSHADNHHALWEALGHWAIRADDPTIWQQSVLDKAIAGPRQLKPHERGQVAHVVSTPEGAKAFAVAEPPAEWLCVFDPRCRYQRPSHLNCVNPASPKIVPFEFYGLDFDEIPQWNGDDRFIHRHTPPQNAWDAFAIAELDQNDLSPVNLPAVRGELARNVAALPSRLFFLGSWIANVINQPAAIWWAVREDSLHPAYRSMIKQKLSHLRESMDIRVYKLWKYLLETRSRPTATNESEWHVLEQDLERDGWSPSGVRRFVSLCEPYLKLVPGVMSHAVPPMLNEEYNPIEVAHVDIECPVPPIDAIPGEWLYQVVRGVRTCIEAAARLCQEVNSYQGYVVSPIEEDPRPDISDYQRTNGLSGCVIAFAALFKRLLAEDRLRAKQEFVAWPLDDDTAFARLRVWASGKHEVATPKECAEIILELNDKVFWGEYHQRDLLIVLAKRWLDLPRELRVQIETRIKQGPSRHEGEKDSVFRERVAWAVLNRLHWLAKNAGELSFDVASETASRRLDAPGWKPEMAENAAESREIMVGFVAKDTGHDALLHAPIGSILSRASELSGCSAANHLLEHDPFEGLCAEHPKRAYLALARAARRSEFPEWAWTTFLESHSRARDSATFSAIVATRLCRIPDTNLLNVLYAATSWLERSGKVMSAGCPEVFDSVVQRLIEVIMSHPESASSSVIDSKRARDWALNAINSPVGQLVDAVFEDSRYQEAATVHSGLRPIEQCLSLKGDSRCYTIVIATRHLDWLYRHARDWTEQHLLTILTRGSDKDQAAFWAGVFWNPELSSSRLFLRIKDGLLAVAKHEDHSNTAHIISLACLLLSGWRSSAENGNEQCLSDSEFRDVLLNGGDRLRRQILMHIEHSLRDDDAMRRMQSLNRAYVFFEKVWPRQRVVKTAEITACIVGILVAHTDGFGKLIDLVLPLLTTISNSTTQLHIHSLGDVKHVIEEHPERFLNLLWSVLSDDVRDWPYSIGDVLSMIAESDESLVANERFRELRSRWGAR